MRVCGGRKSFDRHDADGRPALQTMMPGAMQPVRCQQRTADADSITGSNLRADTMGHEGPRQRILLATAAIEDEPRRNHVAGDHGKVSGVQPDVGSVEEAMAWRFRQRGLRRRRDKCRTSW